MKIITQTNSKTLYLPLVLEANDIQIEEEAVEMAAQEALQGARIVNLLRIEEEPEDMEIEEPDQVQVSPPNAENIRPSNGVNDYARLMVTAEPMSVSTTNVGDGKRVKTIVYRRRSTSLE